MTPTALHRLADRVDRNVPRHGDPEKFHEEKSDIAGELRVAVRESETRKAEQHPVAQCLDARIRGPEVLCPA